MAEKLYILQANDAAGETAEGPFTQAEVQTRATGDPFTKIVTELQLEALRARPRPQETIDRINDTARRIIARRIHVLRKRLGAGDLAAEEEQRIKREIADLAEHEVASHPRATGGTTH